MKCKWNYVSRRGFVVTGEETRQLVDKLWNYCDVLRDDGVSTIDYVEQLTFLLFLKMAHERETRPPAMKRERILPPGLAWQGRGWQELLDADGDKLEAVYWSLLADLGKQTNTTLGVIFRKAQNRIQDPAKLKRLVRDLIDQENWSRQGADINGDAYEELLAKSAEDIKSQTSGSPWRSSVQCGSSVSDGVGDGAGVAGDVWWGVVDLVEEEGEGSGEPWCGGFVEFDVDAGVVVGDGAGAVEQVAGGGAVLVGVLEVGVEVVGEPVFGVGGE